MTRVVSVHEYELRPGLEPADFERALSDAERRGLFDLPGLSEHHFLRGLKGARRGCYAAVWIFESREAWERLWGPPDAPRPPSQYPQKWQAWENEILAPLLSQDPDTIRFTSYEEVGTGPPAFDFDQSRRVAEGPRYLDVRSGRN